MKDQFRIITDFFVQNKMDYAVIGALALHAYGYTRATKDIDFITRIIYQDRLIEYLESLGFETIHKSQGFSNHIHPIGPSRYDFVYVETSTADIIFHHVMEKELTENLTLPVVCPEHLIALKLFALKNDPERKFRELADIKELVKRIKIDPDMITKQDFEKLQLGEYYNDIMTGNSTEET